MSSPPRPIPGGTRPIGYPRRVDPNAKGVLNSVRSLRGGEGWGCWSRQERRTRSWSVSRAATPPTGSTFLLYRREGRGSSLALSIPPPLRPPTREGRAQHPPTLSSAFAAERGAWPPLAPPSTFAAKAPTSFAFIAEIGEVLGLGTLRLAVVAEEGFRRSSSPRAPTTSRSSSVPAQGMLAGCSLVPPLLLLGPYVPSLSLILGQP